MISIGLRTEILGGRPGRKSDAPDEVGIARIGAQAFKLWVKKQVPRQPARALLVGFVEPCEDLVLSHVTTAHAR